MYHKTQTLEELERNYKSIRQANRESVRDYGYRLNEAAERYKKGYKSKYNLAQLDIHYESHIESNMIQTFKRGLNNRALKEKLATNEAKTINKIVEEAEIIENMLLNISDQTDTRGENLQTLNRGKQTTCSYCKRIGHTWDICRTRMSQDRNRRPPYPTQQYNTFRQNQAQQPPNIHYNSNRPEHHQQNNFRNNSQHQYAQAVQPAHYNRNPYANRFPPKYCSHCKTTTGHTFDECRNKLLNMNQPNNYNNPLSHNKERELTERFRNMRINTVYQQPQNATHTTEEEQEQQGNDPGSNQQ